MAKSPTGPKRVAAKLSPEKVAERAARTQADRLAASQIPAFMVDMVLFATGDDFIRMAFAERTPGTPAQFRAAVVLPLENAVVMANRILKIAKDKEKGGDVESGG